MDITSNGGKEKSSYAKKAMTFDKSKDFISDLPDPILVHILSFLPIKDAINTILLRRFGELWRGVHILDFDSCLHHDCREPLRNLDDEDDTFVELISHILDLHDNSTLDKLCLKFGFAFPLSKYKPLPAGYDDDGLERERVTADQIEKLIRYAIGRKVKVLDLNMGGCESVCPCERYDLPDVLSSNYLKYYESGCY